MPTYEYACPKCGLVEAFQSIKEDALSKCPVCKKHKVTRMVSLGGGVIFKGSGFWETDYNRSKEYTDKAKGEHAAPATTTADSTSTPDAKPAAPAGDRSADRSGDKPADKSADKSADKTGSKPAAKTAVEEKSLQSKPQAQPQAKKIDAPAPPAKQPKSPKA